MTYLEKRSLLEDMYHEAAQALCNYPDEVARITEAFHEIFEDLDRLEGLED